MELYYPATNQVTSGPRLPNPVMGATLVGDDGNLVLVGGMDQNTLIYSGDGKWSVYPEKPVDTKRRFAAAIPVTNDELYDCV